MESTNEASQFQNRCWEKRDIILRPVMIYIYLRGNGMQSLYRFFQTYLL